MSTRREPPSPRPSGSPARLPRLGFLGVGWIGRHRMEAVISAGVAQVAAIADPAPEAVAAARASAPAALVVPDLDALRSCDLDGLVIATPSAMHAAQATAALEAGLAVFCQKPLARTAAETRGVIDAARRAGRRLGVDMSYRYTTAFRAAQDALRAGDLGTAFAGEFVFHNAYGPDKPWFRDPARSGGGCLMDLGVHLVDSALHLFGDVVTGVQSRLFAGGRRLEGTPAEIEDYADVRLDFAGGATATIACSWNLHAGRDAVIEFRVFGTRGGVAIRNLNGSFFDLVAEGFTGTGARVLSAPPDEWGGRAIVEWTRRVAVSPDYDCEIESLLPVAEVIDRAYRR